MADNYTVLDSTGATLTFGSDDIGPGVHYARKKIGWGPDGTFNDTDNAAGKRLPVNIAESISLAVTNAALSVVGNGAAATALRVTLANDGTGVLKLWDGTDIADIFDLANSNPLAVAIVDGAGTQITSFGGGVQYTEGDIDATITGTAIMFESNVGTNRLDVVSSNTPLPITVVGTFSVVGAEAVDAPIGGEGLGIVSRASTATPTAVSADGDIQYPWLDLNGRLAVFDGGLALSIDDGGNTITVDGGKTNNAAAPGATNVGALTAIANAGSPSYTEGNLVLLSTDLNGALRIQGRNTDGAAITPTGIQVMGTDGTNAQIIAVDASGNLQVDILTNAALVAGTANIGDVDIASGPTGASALQAQGTAAHDAAAVGNPVLVGARANLNEPTAVADADVTSLWADLLGRLVVLTGHPNPEPPVSLNATASGNTTVIAAPGASLSLYICKGSVHNRAATNRVVRLEDGAAGTIRWRAEVAAEGGGAAFDFGSRGWKLTANTLLNVNLDAAGDVDVNVTEYYIAA